jgi:glutaredoxin
MASTLRRVGPLLLLTLAAWAGMQLISEWGSERIGREMSERARAGDIVMLSSETCAYCKQAREWFGEHRVVFSECFIERDSACAATYNALRAPGTPTLLVRGKPQVGFSAERVAQALRSG